MSVVEAKTAVTLDEHIVEVISDSGEGAQRCGQSLGAIAAKMGNGIWTVEIIPAEIQPPARSIAGASGVRIRIGQRRVTNGGDESDLAVAFNERVLLGRVRANAFKPGATILLESMWRDARPGDRGLVCRDGRAPPSGRLPRHRDPDGGRVPQARRGPTPRQEHVRARHPLQPLQPRRGTRARADPRHVPQEGRAGRRAERRAARGGLDVGGGEPRLPLRDPCRAIEGAAARRQRQHRARARRARLGNGHLRDVPDHARHLRLALPERHVRARRRHRPSGRGRDRRVHVRDRRVLRGHDARSRSPPARATR